MKGVFCAVIRLHFGRSRREYAPWIFGYRLASGFFRKLFFVIGEFFAFYSPLELQILGFYQLFICFEMKRFCCFLGCIRLPVLTWCDEKDVVLADVNLDTIVIPLFSNLCFGPKDPPALPTPPPTASIHVVQTGVVRNSTRRVAKFRVHIAEPS